MGYSLARDSYTKTETEARFARFDAQNTFSQRQRVNKDLLLGPGASARGGDTFMFFGYNIERNAADTAWVRRIADNKVVAMSLEVGQIVVYTQSDAGATVGSVITLVERFRIAANGALGSNVVGFFGKTPVVRPGAVANPTGGLTADAEARAAINGILSALRGLGLITT